MPSSVRSLAALAGTAAVLAAPSAASAAEALYGLTDANRIVRFNSDSPGNVLSSIPIRGLEPGENVVGLDVRPANDTLYAVTNQSRLYSVNPTTGAVRLIGAGPFTPGISGTSFGVDVNPVADALRIVSDQEQNLRMRFADGVFTADAPLQYAAGDPNAGKNPSIGAAAYTNSLPGATSTTLLDIDTAQDVLARQDPPNAGTLTTVGALGRDIAEPVGFDISPANVGYVAYRRADQPPALARIDLATGRLADPAADSGIGLGTRDGLLVGIATAGEVADDGTRPEASVAFSSTILEENTDTLEPSVSCDETCRVTITASVDGRRAGAATETITGAGRETVEVRLDSAARRRIDRRGTELLRLAVSAVDAAGNRTSQERVSRTQTLEARRGGG